MLDLCALLSVRVPPVRSVILIVGVSMYAVIKLLHLAALVGFALLLLAMPVTSLMSRITMVCGGDDASWSTAVASGSCALLVWCCRMRQCS
jgi:hypothetical protein